MDNNNNNNKKGQNMWYLVLGLLSAIYILINLVLPSILGGFFGAYAARPILFILLAITVFLIAKHEGLNIFNNSK